MTIIPYAAKSIADLHRLFFLPAPKHPLITFFDLESKLCLAHASSNSLVFDFYSIWFKKNASGHLGYGQNEFDFSTGTYTFQAPSQVISVDDHQFSSGWALAFHPDFFREYPLGNSIKDYEFFSYKVYQGLALKPEEEVLVNLLVNQIHLEIQSADMTFGQPILVTELELLLKQFDRYYHKQFNPNPKVESDFLSIVESELRKYFNPKNKNLRTLLTVNHLAERLHLTPHHLSEKLKAITGSSALQHIHYFMIEMAKELLSTSALSVSEVAYMLGFEHSQSFSKVFKNKTGFTPSVFQQSLCKKRRVEQPGL
jgi:AraC family transcriptional activator of pobA